MGESWPGQDEVDGGATYTPRFEGAEIIVLTGMVAGRRPVAAAVTLATPASALVATEARAEIDPAGMATRFGTEATTGLSEVNWTTVSELDVAGEPADVWRSISKTEYVCPSVGRTPGTSLMASLYAWSDWAGLLTVTSPVPEV